LNQLTHFSQNNLFNCTTTRTTMRDPPSTRSACVGGRPQSEKLAKFLNKKKQESGLYSAPFLTANDVDSMTEEERDTVFASLDETSFTSLNLTRTSANAEYDRLDYLSDLHYKKAEERRRAMVALGAQDFYPTNHRGETSRRGETRSDLTTQRRRGQSLSPSKPVRQKDLSPTRLKKSIQYIDIDSKRNVYSPMPIKKDQQSPKRSSLLECVPKYARPRPPSIPKNSRRNVDCWY